MAMKLIKKTTDYKIFMRGDDRYAVQDASGKAVNGEEKVRILVEEELIKVSVPGPKKDAAPESEEAVSDEAPEVDAEGAAETALDESLSEPEAPASEKETEPEEAALSESDEEEEAE